MNLSQFVEESFQIEGIDLDQRQLDWAAHNHALFLRLKEITLSEVEKVVYLMTEGVGRLRTQVGMNVRVGNHVPPPGGPQIEADLHCLVERVNSGELSPYEAYCRFEYSHNFLDGNGRAGRLLWLWLMQKKGLNWSQGFLRTFHYQALEQWMQHDRISSWRKPG